MKHVTLLTLFWLTLLTSCDRPQEKCVEGRTYYRNSPSGAWKLEDAAPNHAGITPVPCVEDGKK